MVAQPSASDHLRPNMSATAPVGTSSAKFQNMNQAFRRNTCESESPAQSVKKGTSTAAMKWSQKRNRIACSFQRFCVIERRGLPRVGKRAHDPLRRGHAQV